MAHILIVDDDRFTVKMLTIRLEREGHTLAVVSRGDLVRHSIHERAPDLILLDVLLPARDGYAVAADLKGDPATAAIPIIMVSAMADQRSIGAGITSGADAYVIKPIDFASLVWQVTTLLAGVTLSQRAV